MAVSPKASTVAKCSVSPDLSIFFHSDNYLFETLITNMSSRFFIHQKYIEIETKKE